MIVLIILIITTVAFIALGEIFYLVDNHLTVKKAEKSRENFEEKMKEEFLTKVEKEKLLGRG